MSVKVNGYTFERDIAHCEPSKYIKEVTIKSIEPLPKSDNLNLIKFDEMEYQLISAKNSGYSVGQKVFYFPPETMLPKELSDELDVTKYLTLGRVRAINLRGSRSYGLCCPPEVAKKYTGNIYHWNEPEFSFENGGFRKAKRMSPKYTPDEFVKFYDIPNIMSEKGMFDKNEMIFYSEKIHGSNARFGYMKKKYTSKIIQFLHKILFSITGLEMFSPYQLFVGSHNNVLKTEDDNAWVETVKRVMPTKLPIDYEFFGELFGPGVQKGFHYGRKSVDMLVFAVRYNERYLTVSELVYICRKYGIPHVQFYSHRFESIDALKKIAESPSEYTKDHVSEGIVTVSSTAPIKMAKIINFEYLKSK